MNRAFIFDMDGVIIDSERTWTIYEKEFHEHIFGEKIAEKIDNEQMIGLSLSGIYDVIVALGYTESKNDFYKRYDEMAQIVYSRAEITSGLHTLLQFLKNRKYKLGLVSASPQLWIELALNKANIKSDFDYILSLHENENLQPKPSPDGFLKAMDILGSVPATTIILEDSNRGIQAAKASGAFAIGFREHLLPGYQQKAADAYVNNVEELMLLLHSTF